MPRTWRRCTSDSQAISKHDDSKPPKHVKTNRKILSNFGKKLSPKTGRSAMHVANSNRTIAINNYRQFKFSIHLPSPSADRKPRAKPTTAIKSRIHPRRAGGASGYARAPTSAAARPAAPHSFKLHVTPSGASGSRPFTRPFTLLSPLRCQPHLPPHG